MVSVTSAAGVQALGHAEVEELRRAARGDHDVRRFQVAVQDAVLVRSLQRAGNLDRDADRVCWRERPPHRLTFEVLQHEIVRPDVVHLANVGMVERRDCPRLALESLPVLGRQLLDRHDAARAGYRGPCRPPPCHQRQWLTRFCTGRDVYRLREATGDFIADAPARHTECAL